MRAGAEEARAMGSPVFNVATIEVARIPRLIAGERWVQLQCHQTEDDGPFLVQLPEREWLRVVDTHRPVVIEPARKRTKGDRDRAMREMYVECQNVWTVANHFGVDVKTARKNIRRAASR
jgi:hypothetical protein